MTTRRRKSQYKRKSPYHFLGAWPNLKPATKVRLNMGTLQTSLRVPVKLMRSVGMYPELGVYVSLYGDRILIQGDYKGGPFKQDPDFKQFLLPRSFVGPRMSQANYAIVEGPDYLILTTRREALALAGNAEIIANEAWEKLNKKSADRIDGPLALEDIQVVGWNDVSVTYTNKRAKHGVGKVAGRVWWQAGFNPGDPIRFTRFADATVIEKCAPELKHSEVARASKTGTPGHYIGLALFDLRNLPQIRVIATPGRLIITSPGSPVAALCESPAVGLAAPATKSLTAAVNAPEKLSPVDPSNLDVLAIRDLTSDGIGVGLFGQQWALAGVPPGTFICKETFADAVVYKPCRESEKDYVITRKGDSTKLSLRQTVLENKKDLRAVICKGQIVLTAKSSALSKRFSDAPVVSPGNSKAKAEMLARAKEEHGQGPLKEFATYPAPSAARLQIQGKWLAQLGFQPGERYIVNEKNGVIEVEASKAVGHVIVERSPGSSKLYVPAKAIEALGWQQIRVLGRKGHLTLKSA